MLRLGVVSFLNARPLIDGLDETRGVQCLFDVPSALLARLERREVDVALVPTVDLLRSPGSTRVVSDACIGCDGETMTVRVFSQVPPHRIHTLWVDSDSSTSKALAFTLWRELFQRDLVLRPLEGRPTGDVESVLLIGDKVVDPGRSGFGYEVDLGGAWRQHTGLPFVFAVWACLNPPPASTPPRESEPEGEDRLAHLLSRARDRGVARAAEIAATDGPTLGWPVELAKRYLTRCLRYRLDERAVEGVERFARLCALANLAPIGARLNWPADLLHDRVPT